MFVRFAGRLLINVASLNAQGASGTNYIEITKVPIVLERNCGIIVEEVPAISGNMLKHYHFVHLVDLLKTSNCNKDKLSEYDSRYVAYRFKENKEESINGNKIDLTDEKTVIQNFAIADIHGYLIPKPPSRRESIVKFSFAIPCEDAINKAVEISAVTQNRVVIDSDGKIEGDEQAMMVFKRQYASALYGFASTFDAYYVGRPQSNPKQLVVQGDERKERAKLAVLAYINLLGGVSGANTSRGLPAIEVRELIAVTSNRPIPMAKHGFYRDYIEETIKIASEFSKVFRTKVTVYIYSKNGKTIKSLKEQYKDNKDFEIKDYSSYVELIKAVADDVEKGLDKEEKKSKG